MQCCRIKTYKMKKIYLSELVDIMKESAKKVPAVKNRDKLLKVIPVLERMVEKHDCVISVKELMEVMSGDYVSWKLRRGLV